MQKLAEQVAGKIHWGTPSQEVFAWLKDQKNVSHEDAERLIHAGFKTRRGEVRQRAMIRLIFAGVGMLAFGAFLYLQYVGRFVIYGFPVLIVWGLGLASVGVAIHSLKELLTGESDRPM